MSAVGMPHSSRAGIGDGPLTRAAVAIYRAAALEVMLVVSCLPALAVLLFLAPDPSNAPLAVLALLPLGPAVVAGLAAARTWEQSDEIAPFRQYGRAWRREVLGTLRWWAPSVLVLGILTANLSELAVASLGSALLPITLLLMALLLVWAGVMSVLQARFAFRTRDAARIAFSQLAQQWRLSTGILALLLVLGWITLQISTILAIALAWAAVLLLHSLSSPFVAYVTKHFTRAS